MENTQKPNHDQHVKARKRYFSNIFDHVTSFTKEDLKRNPAIIDNAVKKLSDAKFPRCPVIAIETALHLG